MIKCYLVFVILFLSLFSYSQENTVTLLVSGRGTNPDIARKSALRNAIEQAFGVFISTKTELINEELVNDEITSISNGNIQKFEPISECQLPDGSYASTLKATVSVTKLRSFCESKGMVVEISGSLLAFNIEQIELMRKNEVACIKNLISSFSSFKNKIFDVKVSVHGNPLPKGSTLYMPLIVELTFNENIAIVKDNVYKTLRALSLTKESVNDYVQLKQSVYPVCVSITDNEFDYFLLRNKESIDVLKNSFYELFTFDFCVYINDNQDDCIKIKGINNKKLLPAASISSYYDKIFDFVMYGQPMFYVNVPEISHFIGVRHKSSFLDSYSNVRGAVKSEFSAESLRFVKKIQNKMKDIPIGNEFSKQMDGYKGLVNVGHVFTLNQVNPKDVYCTYWFYDMQFIDELKKIKKYSVRLF